LTRFFDFEIPRFMKTKALRRRPASITKTRWTAYAMAGAATALAGSNSSEAAIHYSGILHVHFPPDSDKQKTFPLDQPGDALFFDHTYGTYFNNAFVSVRGIVSAHVRGFTSSSEAFAYKLSYGENISAGFFTFYNQEYGPPLLAACTSRGFAKGYFRDRGIGYIGFKFNNGAGIQYGWARVSMSGCPQTAFRVVAYAYADPGESITAGQRSSTGEQAPDEGSLGWLALGAVGLLVWRKSRSRTARHTALSLPV
jgi:hypothetical protein